MTFKVGDKIILSDKYWEMSGRISPSENGIVCGVAKNTYLIKWTNDTYTTYDITSKEYHKSYVEKYGKLDIEYYREEKLNQIGI